MVKKVKGLSFDEKKAVLSRAMMREGMYYNLKELETLGKRNGVIPQAVKEVVDCLIAERIVIQEKIGSLNIFWAFGSNETASLEGQISAAVQTAATNAKQISALETRLGQVRSDCPPKLTPLAVAAAAKEVSDLEAKQSELKRTLDELLKSDPATIACLEEQLCTLKRAVNVWTDNIYILRQFFTSKLGLSDSAVNSEFGIPQDLDLVD